MGGNLIENSERITREDFFLLFDEIKKILPDFEMSTLKFYRNKKDFGDLDIILKRPDDENFNLRKMLSERFNFSNQEKDMYSSHDDSVSIRYKNHQVDFISVAEDEYESSINYFNWNDLGNLLSVTATNMGFSFGSRGLEFKLKFKNGEPTKSIIVSKDFYKSLEFMGFDSDVYKKGFDTEEDYIKFAINSKFENKYFFDILRKSAEKRAKINKRSVYKKLFKMLEESDIHSYEVSQDFKDYNLKRAIDFFGNGFINDINEYLDNKKKKEEYQSKIKVLFNGNVISAITGRQKQEISELKNFIDDNKLINFDSILLLKNEIDMKNKIEKIIKDSDILLKKLSNKSKSKFKP